jgi:DNA-binding transcriptional ArsR family regulator
VEKMTNSINSSLTHYQTILLLLLSRQKIGKKVYFQEIQSHLKKSIYHVSQLLSKLEECNLIEKENARPQPINITTLGEQNIINECITPFNAYISSKFKADPIKPKEEKSIPKPTLKTKEVSKNLKKIPSESKLLNALPKMIDKLSSKIKEDISTELDELESYISKPTLTELHDNITDIIEFYHAELKKGITKLK